MSNSPLICYTKISPNRNSPRKSAIKKITIHHMAGNLSIEACGNVFAPVARQASSNYGIGSDGRIGMYVEEKDRAWTSSNANNDHQAVTIEVANDEIGGQWHVSDKAMASLIDLCVDICKRNKIAKLNYTGNKNGNLTMHKWFAATACPGPYLESKFPYIAEQVNMRLGASDNTSTPDSSTSNAPAGSASLEFKKGDFVQFTGHVHYSSVNALSGSSTRPSRAKITSTSKSGVHPYHCRAVNAAGSYVSGVYGWVDAEDVKADNAASGGTSGPSEAASSVAVGKPRTVEPSYTDKHWLHTKNGGLNECIEINNSGSCLPNCVGYAWGRFYEFTGKRPNLSKANAENWYPHTADGYNRSQSPAVGAVICWRKGQAGNGNDGAGHVAIVEEVKSNGDVVTSNSAYGGKRFYMQTVTKASGYSIGDAYTFQGFILPPGATPVGSENSGGSTAQGGWTPKVGDIVTYHGNIHYVNANSPTGHSCKGGKAKITSIYRPGKSKHPYHLVHVAGQGATVYGWVDDDTFTKA